MIPGSIGYVSTLQKKESTMKTFTRLMSLAIVSGGLLAAMPVQADTFPHRVYNQSYTVTDPFSILDRYQNNVLTPEDYIKGNLAASFSSVDTDGNGFVSRSEFYGNREVARNEGWETRHYRLTNHYGRTTAELTRITPAAGGTDYTTVRRDDIVYHDDPCDNAMFARDNACK
jgi:hypothetical protein